LKSKSELSAKWVIGLTLCYPILLIFLFLSDSIDTNYAYQVFVDICIYISIPLFFLDWFLIIRSLRFEKTTLAYIGLIITIFYSLILVWVVFVFSNLKMC